MSIGVCLLFPWWRLIKRSTYCAPGYESLASRMLPSTAGDMETMKLISIWIILVL